MTKISKPVLALLTKIAAGESHRATHATYEAALQAGLVAKAEPFAPAPWLITAAGRAALDERLYASQVEVYDSEYRFTHGRAPRGVGFWAFSFGSKKAEPTWILDASGKGQLTFAAARRIACQQAAAQGIDRIFVCT